MMRTTVPFATRVLALVLGALTASGCSGTGNHLIPAAPPAFPAAATLPTAAGAAASVRGVGPGALAVPDRARPQIPVRVALRIPRRSREHDRMLHPATISSLTQSLGISVDGHTAKVFNTTPTSPGCSAGAAGISCTFSLGAPVGTDTFAVTTYAAPSGGGSALDRGLATVKIVKAKANQVVVSLGPVVTTTADSGMGSLRYAVGSANAGDTILFLLNPGATIALASPITLSHAVTIAGPGASNLTIDGGSTHELFYVTGTATISGVSLAHGKATMATVAGGAVYNVGALTLANDVIGNNTSVVMAKAGHPHPIHASFGRLHPHCTVTDYQGGAVYNNGSLTISGTTFQNNVVSSDETSCIYGQGGAIYNDADGTLASTGDTYSGNAAFEGGAVFNVSQGSATFTNDAFTSNKGCDANSGCLTTGCNSTSCSTFADGQGAAIADNGLGITVTASTFTNNVAGGATPASVGQGGAILLASSMPTITGSTFSGNLAGGGAAACSSGTGGAIYVATNVELDNDTFTSNTSSGDGAVIAGGAIGTLASSISVSGRNDTFTGNQAIATHSACGSAQAIGGAAIATGTATFASSTFANNTASGPNEGGGGAIAAAQVVLSSDAFTSNSAIGTGSGGVSSTGAGGAVYLQNGGKIVSSTFTTNSATASGAPSEIIGGAAASVSGTLTLSGNTYASNTVSATGGTPSAFGGAVGAIAGTVFADHETYRNNTVTSPGSAGAGAMLLNAQFQVSGATMTGNTVSGVTEGAGGAIATGGPGGTLSNSTVSGNSATSSAGIGAGGAIFDNAGTNLDNDTFMQNAATTIGGAIMTANGSTINSTTVTGNSVAKASVPTSGGGGIYGMGVVVLVDSTVANNSLATSGPGPAGGAGLYIGGGMLASQNTISGNTLTGNASSGGGGGILAMSGILMEDSTISGNSSTLDGGGLLVGANDPITLYQNTLYKNSTSGAGGNIENLYSIALANSIVAGGKATGNGGDIDNGGTVTSGDYNIIQNVFGNPLAGTTTHDLAVDPQLLPLANNGGGTFTNADQAASPGTGYIPFVGSACGTLSISLDQRGYTRGAGGKCDVGAYEYNGVPTAIRRRLEIPAFSAHHRRGIELQMPHLTMKKLLPT